MSSLLPAPTTSAGKAGLAALVGDPRAALVALDYDGTLSPIVDRPEDALPAPGALDMLEKLVRHVGTVAIVTGRPVRDVVAFAELERPELRAITVLGNYGLERWSDGTAAAPAPEPGVAAARQLLPGVLADAPDGVSVEDKQHALVVHTRRAAEPAVALEELRPRLTQLAEQVGLEAAAGRFVVELRPRGVDKGTALGALVRSRSARAVLFAGDDVGDLPAFAAVEALRRDGVAGLTVCSGSDEVPDLRRRADLVVDGPTGVVSLLNALLAAVGR